MRRWKIHALRLPISQLEFREKGACGDEMGTRPLGTICFDRRALFVEQAGVLRAIGFPLMAVAMLSILGGHWAILQAVAWSQMLRDYSRDASLGVAVEKTFSGKYPCSLCKRVAEERQREEQKTPLVKLEKKSVEIAPEPVLVIVQPPAGEFRYPPVARMIPSERFDAPPRPVPRALVG